MEPVDIEIRMRQNVAEESEKASKGVGSIGMASSKATRDLDSQVQRQLITIDKINKALDALEKRASAKTSSGVDASQVDATMARIGNLRQMLDEAREQLVSMRSDAEKLNAVVASMVQNYQEVEQAIKKMNTAGKGSSPAMDSMREEQRVIADALGETGTEVEKTFAKMSGLGMATKEEFDAARKSVKQQTEMVRGLKTELDGMQKQYDSMDAGKQKDTLGADLEATRKQYAGAVVDLDRMKIKQDELQISSRRLTEQMEGLRDKMIKLRLEGKDNTEEYRQLEGLYKRLASESAAVKFGGQDKSKVQGLVQGVTGLAGAMTAGVGVMGLFNGKSEEMEKIQARLQSMIAITIGLQEAHNLVDKQGAFYAMYLSKAKNVLTAANLRLATALGISTAAATALMAALTLGASVAIIGLIALMSKLSSKSAEAAESMRQISEKAAEGAAEPIVMFKKLQKGWNDLGNDLKAKQQFIIDNAEAFKQLGVQVGTVDEAENLFVTNADTFVDSIMKRAMAAAIMDVAAEKYKKALEKMLKASQMPDTIDYKVSSYSSQYGLADSNTLTVKNAGKERAMAAAEDGMKEVGTTLNKFIDDALANTDLANENLSKAGIRTAEKVAVGTKAYWEQMQKNYLATINSMTDKEVGTKKWVDAVKNYKNATAKVALFDIKGNDSKAKTAAEKVLAANDSLSKMSLDYDSKIEAARAAAVKTGRAARLADAKADFDKQKAQLEKDLIAIENLEKVTGKPATEQRNKNTELGTAVEQQFKAKVDTINTVADRALADIMDNVAANFQGELDRNLSTIDGYYDDILRKAEEEGASEEQLSNIRQARFMDKAKARRDESLKVIDFDLEIEKRRIEISDKSYLFQADRQKDIVKAEREAMVKRLAVMQAQYASTPTPELARDIESAKLSLDEFDETLKNLDESKLEEIAALAQSLSKLGGALSKTGGVLGEVGGILSGVSSSADDIMTSFKKSSSTMDKISAGISGLADLYSMVADQIAANKAEQDEWTDAIKASEQAARMARIEQEAYQQSNIFGVESPYAKVMASVKQYMAAMKELNDYSNELSNGKVQTGTKKVVSGENIAKGAGAGAAVGAAVASIIPGVGTVVGGLIGGLIGGAVGAATTKIVPVFKSLKDTYGKVIMDDMSLNPKILQDYDKLDETTKKMVDNWEEIKTKAKEAQDEMNAALTDLAGDLGTKLSDSLVEAFRNGDVYDAIDDFHGKVTETIEDIIAQLIFAAAFGDLFDELGKRFKDSFAIGGDGSIVDDLMWFDSSYKGRLDAYNTGMKQMQEQGKKLGYEFFSPTSERSGTSKGISTASQESISELSGGVLSMRSMLAELRNMQRDELTIMRSINTTLFGIEENTAYCRLLETMETNMERMANVWDEITVRGLKVNI